MNRLRHRASGFWEAWQLHSLCSPILHIIAAPHSSAVGLGASHNLGALAPGDADLSASARGSGGLSSLARSPAPSDPGSPARRPAVVPRLSLPVAAAGSTPGTASRRSSAGGMEPRGGGDRNGAGPAADLAGEPNALALQRLGHACGQSAMCADLAAFVAHKQARCLAPGAPRGGRAGAPPSARGGGWEVEEAGFSSESEGEGDAPGAADAGSKGAAAAGDAWLRSVGRVGVPGSTVDAPEQWRTLPEPLRAKLLLLTCLARVADCYAAARRPPPLAPVNLLVSELLVSGDDMAALCRAAGWVKGGAAARAPAAATADGVAAGVAALRRLAMGVVTRFGRLPAGDGDGGSSGGGPSGAGRDDDTLALDARPKQHDDVVSQLRHRVARLVGQDKETMRGGLRGRGRVRACRGPLAVCKRK